MELIEPQQTALAKLCSYCIYASVELQQNSVVKTEAHKTTNNMDIVQIYYKITDYLSINISYFFRILIIHGLQIKLCA